MNQKHGIIFLGVLVAIIWLGLVVFRGQADRQQIAAAEELREKAFAISAVAFPEEIAREILGRLFAKIKGRPLQPAVTQKLLRDSVRGLPVEGFSLFVVDHEERLLWSSRPAPEIWKVAQDRLGALWLRNYALPVPSWRYLRPNEQPNILLCWITDPDSRSGDVVGGAVLAIDVTVVTRWRLLEWVIRHTSRAPHTSFGLIDRVTLDQATVPTGLLPDAIFSAFDQHLRQQGPWVASEGRLLVFHLIDNSRLFVGLIDRIPIKIHPGFWLVIALWTLSCWAIGKIVENRAISLKYFLCLSFGIAAGFPLLLTILFWSVFEKNRVDSLVSSELKAMEQQLVHIDNQMSLVKRQRHQQYRSIIKRFDAVSAASFSSALADLAEIELKNDTFDYFFLISSAGVNLRDWSVLDPTLRGLVARSPAEKRAILPAILSNGPMLRRDMVELTMRLSVHAECLPDLWSCKLSDDHTQRTKDGIGVFGKIILGDYNEGRGLTEFGEKTGDKSTLVYGSMIDSHLGDFCQTINANLGETISLGSGKGSAWGMFDVVHDTKGIGQYLVFTFTNMRSVEHAFLQGFFADQRRWPKNQYFAAESAKSQLFFPINDRRHSLSRYFDRVAPPRVLFSKVVSRGARKELLAAYNAQALAYFTLFSSRPWSVIEEGQAVILQQMGILLVLMFLFMAGVFWRIYRGIVVPAEALGEGIKALAEQRFNHVIPYLTGDEWDDLAEAFNTAIAGMEELQVAATVQKMILPARIIRGKAGEFLGKSVMTGHVGGDYFDALADETTGDLNFVIADVTGHGVSAALVVAMAKSCFNYLHGMGVRSPAEFLNRINGVMLAHLARKKGLGMFVGHLTSSGKLYYSNAGQPFPYVITPGLPVTQLTLPGMPLGMTKRAVFQDHECPVASGTRLVLYSDGIIEQTTASGDAFGYNGLQEILCQCLDISAEELIEAIQQALRSFSGTHTWDDDVTIACLQVTWAKKSQNTGVDP